MHLVQLCEESFLQYSLINQAFSPPIAEITPNQYNQISHTAKNERLKNIAIYNLKVSIVHLIKYREQIFVDIIQKLAI